MKKTNIKINKNLLAFFLSFMVAAFSSCVIDESERNNLEYRVIEFSIPYTRAGEDLPDVETKVSKIDLLVFDNNSKNFLYRTSGENISVTGNEIRFEAKFQISNKAISVQLFANSPDRTLEVNYNDKTESEVLNALILEEDVKTFLDPECVGLPMHGTFTVDEISHSSTSLSLNPSDVVLLRSLVKIQIVVDADPLTSGLQEVYLKGDSKNGGFRIIQTSITNTNEKGLFPVDEANIEYESGNIVSKVSEPSFPSSNLFVKSRVTFDKYESGLQESLPMYCYENSNDGSGSNSLGSVPRLMIAGSFGTDKTVYYYWVDFEDSHKNKIHLLRNNVYQINIEKIDNEGSLSDEDGMTIDATIRGSIIIWGATSASGTESKEEITLPTYW